MRTGKVMAWIVLLMVSLGVLTAVIFYIADRMVTENVTPDPDYVIASDESASADAASASSDATGTTKSKLPEEWQPDSLCVIDMMTFAAGTILSRVDEDFMDQYFQIYEIDETVFERINGRSYTENPDITIDDLRYLKVIHYNYNHEVQVGEIIVNAAIAEDTLAVFRELYEAEYEIYSLVLIDDFWDTDGLTTDEISMAANNSSGFCYRKISNSDTLSNHALGLAIDLNPVENPYAVYVNGEPSTTIPASISYLDRSEVRDHMIMAGDTCYRIFTSHGFTWGGDWTSPKDYMHFEYEL